MTERSGCDLLNNAREVAASKSRKGLPISPSRVECPHLGNTCPGSSVSNECKLINEPTTIRINLGPGAPAKPKEPVERFYGRLEGYARINGLNID